MLFQPWRQVVLGSILLRLHLGDNGIPIGLNLPLPLRRPRRDESTEPARSVRRLSRKAVASEILKAAAAALRLSPCGWK